MIKVWFPLLNVAVSCILLSLFPVTRTWWASISHSRKSLQLSVCSLTKPCLFFLPTDKHETKLKGVIYFQAIEEVYYDHLRSATKVRLQTLISSHLFHTVYFHLSFPTFCTFCRFFSLCLCFLLGRLLSQKGFFNLNISVCIHTFCSNPSVSKLQSVCVCCVWGWLLMHAPNLCFIIWNCLIFMPICQLNPVWSLSLSQCSQCKPVKCFNHKNVCMFGCFYEERSHPALHNNEEKSSVMGNINEKWLEVSPIRWIVHLKN